MRDPTQALWIVLRKRIFTSLDKQRVFRVRRCSVIEGKRVWHIEYPDHGDPFACYPEKIGSNFFIGFKKEDIEAFLYTELDVLLWKMGILE